MGLTVEYIEYDPLMGSPTFLMSKKIYIFHNHLEGEKKITHAIIDKVVIHDKGNLR